MNTTEESLEGSEPCVSDDGNFVLVMDGYLTNWEELRRELLGRRARLRNRSDAELVLHAYQEWGDDCPRHIDGEYALIVWDARLQGHRPLYYSWDGASFIAASDLAALHAALPSAPELNLGYVAELMANRLCTRDETVWIGVKRLLGAHRLSLKDGRLQIGEYWQLPTDIRIKYPRDEDYIDHYRELLSDCVRRSSRSHLPVAFEVSGGLDSSALFSMAHRLHLGGDLPAPEINGYTLAGDPGTGADETYYARLVGQFVGRPIAEIPLFCPDIEWFASEAAANCDMPTYPNGPMSIGLEHAAAMDSCRVIISGNGGDQWLDGERRCYDEQLQSRDWRGLAASLREDSKELGWGQTASTLLVNAVAPRVTPSLRRALRRIWPAPESSAQIEPYWLAAELRSELARREASSNSRSDDNWRTGFKRARLESPYLGIGLDLMAHQRAKARIDGRSPMLSRAFIEFCSTTPERTRLRGAVNRFTHRASLAGLMPDEVRNRRTKAHFDTVFTRHEQAVIRQCKTALREGFGELVDHDGLRRVLQDCCDTTIDNTGIWELWGVYVGSALWSNKLAND
jgi:asparagine synthase (glutamine-hydrolysing)